MSLRLILGSRDLAWQDRGLCNQTDPDAFHPEKGGSPEQAKRICRRCEVKTVCLQYALTNREEGVWGGTTKQERNKILRARKAGQGAAA
ncbi:WhiB family transcriptional regulator [Verrucosispora sp. WMMD1129]|uniref:WhiB family transcriptional regulator n=1 Tax=Verrucosispora sp. WMMD1129 TaxID=3016093 RepID=UPI00249C6A6B|nr:WhiB family transcriptional regulator [Verrucosispora sp. WMMD1129]WFE45329.1 WhiB family transcriptional regulator [Verrucosispora sp. WMMD1129]